METQVHNEITFYEDGNVRVTPSRYVTNSKTYAIRNISSVHVFKIVKSKAASILLILTGIILLILPEGKIVGSLLFIVGLSILMRKNEYAVRISTNAGESNSIVSKDKIYVKKIVDALNEAIMYGG